MISSLVPALVSRGPRIEAGATAAQRASTFWSRCGPGLDPGFRSGAWHPLAGRCFPCAYGELESPTSSPTPRSGARHGLMTIETAPVRRSLSSFVFLDTTR